MIRERMILPRIQNFKQRTRRITAEVGRELIDFIQHDDWIARSNST
jgi:hypothetical protein